MAKLITLTEFNPPNRTFALNVAALREAWPRTTDEPDGPAVLYINPYVGNDGPVVVVAESVADVVAAANGEEAANGEAEATSARARDKT